jgi:hypothetical protein
VAINLVQPLVAIIAPSLSAAMAAYIGTRFALRKHVREKAFDARREWYEQATRAVAEFVSSLRGYSRYSRRNASEAVLDEILVQLHNCVQEMNSTLGLAYLYARPRTIEAAMLLLDANAKLFVPVSGEATFRDGSVEKAELFARTVFYDLAIEFREHLGLERLPQKLVPTLALDARKRDSL